MRPSCDRSMLERREKWWLRSRDHWFRHGSYSTFRESLSPKLLKLFISFCQKMLLHQRYCIICSEHSGRSNRVWILVWKLGGFGHQAINSCEHFWKISRYNIHTFFHDQQKRKLVMHHNRYHLGLKIHRYICTIDVNAFRIVLLIRSQNCFQNVVIVCARWKANYRGLALSVQPNDKVIRIWSCDHVLANTEISASAVVLSTCCMTKE